MKKIMEMDETEYRSELNEKIIDKQKVKLCNKINKELLKICTLNPNKALLFCEINSEVYLSNCELELYAQNLHAKLFALLNLKETDKLLITFKEAIKFVIENDYYEFGLQYLDIVTNAFEYSIISNEEQFKFAKYVIDFHLNFNEFELSIDIMCNLAFEFASVKAYQSAYRLINDAQEIITKNNLNEKQVDILFTQGLICLYEGDYEAAEHDLRNAMRFIDTLSIDKKVSLLINFATLMMKTENYKEANSMYQEIQNN